MAITIYPMSDYPAGPLERFVTGAQQGAQTMLDLRTKADNLETQIYEHAQAKKKAEAVGAAMNQQAQGGVTTANMPAIGAASGGGSPGSGGNAGSSTGGAGTGGITPQDLYSYLSNNRNANPNEAAMITASANAESNFRPDVTHDVVNGQPIGYGLFGHNRERLQAMYKYAGLPENSPVGTKVPWQTQASFALDELRNNGPLSQMVNNATTPAQLTEAQMHYEQPAGYTARNPTALNRDGTHGGNWDQRLAATSEYMKNPPLLPQQPTGPGMPRAETTNADGTPTQPAPASAGPAPTSTASAPASTAPAPAIGSDYSTGRASALGPVGQPGYNMSRPGGAPAGPAAGVVPPPPPQQQAALSPSYTGSTGSMYMPTQPTIGQRSGFVPLPNIGGGYALDYSQYAPGAMQAMALAPPGQQNVWGAGNALG